MTEHEERVAELRDGIARGKYTVEDLDSVMDESEETRDAYSELAEKLYEASHAWSAAEHYNDQDVLDGIDPPSLDFWTLQEWGDEAQEASDAAERTREAIFDVIDNWSGEEDMLTDDDDMIEVEGIAHPVPRDAQVIQDGDTTVVYYPNNELVGEVVVNGVAYTPEAVAPIETTA